MRYFYTSTRIAVIKNTDQKKKKKIQTITKADKDVEKQEPPYIADRKLKW